MFIAVAAWHFLVGPERERHALLGGGSRAWNRSA